MSESPMRRLKSTATAVCLATLGLTLLPSCYQSTAGDNTGDGEGIFFVQSSEQPTVSHTLAWGLPTVVLRDNPSNGVALEFAVPAGSTSGSGQQVDRKLEFFVLSGRVLLAGSELTAGDYLEVPAGLALAPPYSADGSRLLMFSVGGYPDVFRGQPKGTAQPKVIRGAQQPWVGGTAMKAAGRLDVPLKIKHFRNDPVSGARTYLVSVGPGLAIPWETHTVAEEGYLVSGDYTLPECLPGGLRSGRYEPGGYFYRPPGIAHNGPQSGSRRGAVMLVRTPGPLTVTLVDGCQ